ncbi:hypothetical protein [Sorangium sp. So ce1151]|uniref:hypothetical protein n=1 Tax=Sorangium sp. So ce1151 TaxID=3133332 RepID=UPI003F5EC583
MKLKLSAVVLCGGVAVVLAPACDLTYTCDTVEPGSAGAGYPTESVGAGDYLRDGHEGGGEEVGSDSFELMAGCTPVHDCTDMFEKCQDIGGRCTRRNSHGYSYCEICRDECQQDKPYTYVICFQCGFK